MKLQRYIYLIILPASPHTPLYVDQTLNDYKMLVSILGELTSTKLALMNSLWTSLPGKCLSKMRLSSSEKKFKRSKMKEYDIGSTQITVSLLLTDSYVLKAIQKLVLISLTNNTALFLSCVESLEKKNCS